MIAQLRTSAIEVADRLGVTIAVLRVHGQGRDAERTAGRAAARQAFVLAGAAGLGVVGSEDDGRPRWPDGWTGSISHGAGVAVAAISARRRAVGIDVERSGALTAEDAELVLAPAELEMAVQASDPAFVATMIWSAKEAAFKAWSTACGGLEDVDPVDIRIDFDLGDGAVWATPESGLPAPTIPEQLRGCFATVAGLLLTVVVGGATSTNSQARESWHDDRGRSTARCTGGNDGGDAGRRGGDLLHAGHPPVDV